MTTRPTMTPAAAIDGEAAMKGGFKAGARVVVNIPNHQWHGLRGISKFGGNHSHYVVCDSGRCIAPVQTHELLPDPQPPAAVAGGNKGE